MLPDASASLERYYRPKPCINGMTVALGAYFEQDIDGVVDRLIGEQLDDGGWNCPESGAAGPAGGRSRGAAPDKAAARPCVRAGPCRGR